ISNELVDKELLLGSLFNITDPVILEKYIHTYLSIPEFSNKDTRGNRMYSNALKYYKVFSEESDK
ncbi:hypothetical protein V7149_21005, partial [Bacillus sp. JJ1503]|uniref:hypothetical protein n=1 Tax=Bacillus sp. JJ1503 TaxID=3122956 RepID=UPI0030005E5C